MVTETSVPSASQMLEEAIALDPKFADAYALLGTTYNSEVLNGWSRSPGKDLAKAFELSQKEPSLWIGL
jgi:Tfp pilus assembly protein PilF